MDQLQHIFVKSNSANSLPKKQHSLKLTTNNLMTVHPKFEASQAQSDQYEFPLHAEKRNIGGGGGGGGEVLRFHPG